jgi:hypothetical protein
MTMHVELEALKRRLYIDNAVRNIKFFPGSERDASPEDFAREMNKYFVEAENTESTEDLIDVDC